MSGGAGGIKEGRGQLLRCLRALCLYTSFWDLLRGPITDSACTCQDTFAVTGLARFCLSPERAVDVSNVSTMNVDETILPHLIY